jgi:anthranilate synthase component 1
MARYSFIGKDPLLTVRIEGDSATIRYRDGSAELREGNPYKIVEEIMKPTEVPKLKVCRGFPAGWSDFSAMT